MSGAPAQLLAKSPRPGRPPLTLEQHLIDTDLAASTLFAEGTRWHEALCRFFKLSDSERVLFLPSLRVAALAHDIGKANADFLQALEGKGFAQTVRHEHLSAIFLHHPQVRAWLKASARVDFPSIVAAVATHHLKCARDGDYVFGRPRYAPTTRLYFSHPEISATLKRMAAIVGADAPRLADAGLYPGTWEPAWADARTASRSLETRMLTESCALTFALKAALVASDTVASGLVREGHPITAWLNDVAHRAPIDAATVRRDIIDPRVQSIEARTGTKFTFQSFQDGAAKLSSRALLLAACGSGKTLAAWRWAESQAAARPVGRVVFLYPTRGTATEGFRDYVGWAPEGDGALVHGTSRYELEGMTENPSDSVRDKRLVNESEARLFALALWSKRYFSATVDQFLSFMENRYESLCLVPALADALVILDEVHSYDDRMFQNLLEFLKRTNVPVLAMTATLSPDRRRQLEALELETYPREEHREELKDLERLECHPRYRHERLSSADEAMQKAIEAVANGQRVLWVVNVVRRAQALSRQLRSRVSCPTLTYHSRFRLKDRQAAHRRTVEAFQGDSGAVIAVTTQVCEMSLDLDADVLITEDAPISSLVQRFGRANRHLKRGDNFRATLHTYVPESELPYEPDDLRGGREFLESLPEEPSQRDLATLLETLSPRARDAPTDAARFFGGGYFATPGEFRDIDAIGKASVLDVDLDEVTRRLKAREPIDGFVVQVPRKFAVPSASPLPQWLSIAPSDHYDTSLGFLDEER